MSVHLSKSVILLFDAEVKNNYQSRMNLLKNNIRSRYSGEQWKYRFRKIGHEIAIERTEPTKESKKWNAAQFVDSQLRQYETSEYTSVFDNIDIYTDEKIDLIESIVASLGRRSDQIIIDAIRNSNCKVIGEKNKEISIELILNAINILNCNDQPNKDRVLLIHPLAIKQMMKTINPAGDEYKNLFKIMTGESNMLLGLKVIMIGDRKEKGLIHKNRATAYICQKDAVGYAEGADPKTLIYWVADLTKWLVIATIRAGASLVDKSGVISIKHKISRDF